MALLSKTVVMRRNNRVHFEAIGQDFMADEGGRLKVGEGPDDKKE